MGPRLLLVRGGFILGTLWMKYPHPDNATAAGFLRRILRILSSSFEGASYPTISQDQLVNCAIRIPLKGTLHVKPPESCNPFGTKSAPTIRAASGVEQ
jgi:hypothetical protein